MLSKKMQEGLNAQIVAELFSSYLYASMAAWCQDAGYAGAANWMSVQAREEAFHASKFYNYILSRFSQVKLGAISAPPAKWKTPQEVFEDAFAHEQKVTGLINNLVSLAKAESDHATEIFLQWFVTEQIEEETNTHDIAQKFKMAAGQASALFMIDQELAARTLGADAIAGLTSTASSTAAGTGSTANG